MSVRPAPDPAETDDAAPSLAGRWIKDKSQSDPMDEACDLMELPWIYRKAMAFLTTLLVEDSDEHFLTTLKAGGIMDVIECYPWGPGRSCGPVVVTNGVTSDGVVSQAKWTMPKGIPASRELWFSWDAPLPGRGSDRFVLSPDGRMMTQFSELHLAMGGSCAFRTVYRRAPQ